VVISAAQHVQSAGCTNKCHHLSHTIHSSS